MIMIEIEKTGPAEQFIVIRILEKSDSCGACGGIGTMEPHFGHGTRGNPRVLTCPLCKGRGRQGKDQTIATRIFDQIPPGISLPKDETAAYIRMGEYGQ